eukprot:gnl/MRDRNA2_/MRDRNA2_142840_c0_seq1.p1 gnl/MRDRNA2_/MRDRNA2_142840_c0~~gnl/MRDRNA2_/MRDRNA2_142840_c0_seq1.p1  ORF type:complete len:683 (-),score=135.04 gnl/MRDRNA2_/MRDRNA2_142840_c0_seq1:11-1945(-)
MTFARQLLSVRNEVALTTREVLREHAANLQDSLVQPILEKLEKQSEDLRTWMLEQQNITSCDSKMLCAVHQTDLPELSSKKIDAAGDQTDLLESSGGGLRQVASSAAASDCNQVDTSTQENFLENKWGELSFADLPGGKTLHFTKDDSKTELNLSMVEDESNLKGKKTALQAAVSWERHAVEWERHALKAAKGWVDEEMIRADSFYISPKAKGQKSKSKPQISLRQFVHSTAFELFCSSIIAANAIFMGIQVDRSVRDPEGTTTIREDFALFRLFFLSCFTLELLLRLLVNRIHFFFCPHWRWNVFDFVVVCLSLLEEFLESLADTGFSNLSFLRLLRLLRLARIVRIIRVFRFFYELRVMVTLMLGCLKAVLWAMLLLLLMIYIFGLVFCQAAADQMSASDDLTHNGHLRDYFGNLRRGCFSLWKAVSGGADWETMAQALIDIDINFGYVFSFYILFIVLGVFNVITSLIVQEANRQVTQDHDIVIKEEMSRQDSYMRGILRLFKEADTDKSGTLTWEKLEAHLEDDRVKAFFRSLELDISEARGLFMLLDLNDNGVVNADEFVTGCLRLKGSAKSIDVATLLYENKRMCQKWAAFMSFCDKQLNETKQLVRETKVLVSKTMHPHQPSNALKSNEDKHFVDLS